MERALDSDVAGYLRKLAAKGPLGKKVDRAADEALFAKAAAGDEDARWEVVRVNTPMVVALARHYLLSPVARRTPMLDLIQEGIIGLKQAADKFDPDLGFKFATYATLLVRQHMRRYVQTQSSTVHLPSHVYGHMVKAKIAADLGSSTELTARQADNVESARRATQIAGRGMADEVDVVLEGVTDREMPVVDRVSLRENTVRVVDALQHLLPRQRQVVEAMFGLGDRGGHKKSLVEVGREIGVTKERVRQISTQALDRLRRVLVDE